MKNYNKNVLKNIIRYTVHDAEQTHMAFEDQSGESRKYFSVGKKIEREREREKQGTWNRMNKRSGDEGNGELELRTGKSQREEFLNRKELGAEAIFGKERSAKSSHADEFCPDN